MCRKYGVMPSTIMSIDYDELIFNMKFSARADSLMLDDIGAKRKWTTTTEWMNLVLKKLIHS